MHMQPPPPWMISKKMKKKKVFASGDRHTRLRECEMRHERGNLRECGYLSSDIFLMSCDPTPVCSVGACDIIHNDVVM